MKTFHLLLQTPEGVSFEEEAESLVFCGLQGRYGILAGHAPMTAGIEAGTLDIVQAGQPRRFVLGDGLVEVTPERVTFLVTCVLPAEGDADVEEKIEQIRRSAAARPAQVAEIGH